MLFGDSRTRKGSRVQGCWTLCTLFMAGVVATATLLSSPVLSPPCPHPVSMCM